MSKRVINKTELDSTASTSSGRKRNQDSKPTAAIRKSSHVKKEEKYKRKSVSLKLSNHDQSTGKTTNKSRRIDSSKSVERCKVCKCSSDTESLGLLGQIGNIQTKLGTKCECKVTASEQDPSALRHPGITGRAHASSKSDLKLYTLNSNESSNTEMLTSGKHPLTKLLRSIAQASADKKYEAIPLKVTFTSKVFRGDRISKSDPNPTDIDEEYINRIIQEIRDQANSQIEEESQKLKETIQTVLKSYQEPPPTTTTTTTAPAPLSSSSPPSSSYFPSASPSPSRPYRTPRKPPVPPPPSKKPTPFVSSVPTPALFSPSPSPSPSLIPTPIATTSDIQATNATPPPSREPSPELIVDEISDEAMEALFSTESFENFQEETDNNPLEKPADMFDKINLLSYSYENTKDDRDKNPTVGFTVDYTGRKTPFLQESDIAAGKRERIKRKKLKTSKKKDEGKMELEYILLPKSDICIDECFLPKASSLRKVGSKNMDERNQFGNKSDDCERSQDSEVGVDCGVQPSRVQLKNRCLQNVQGSENSSLEDLRGSNSKNKVVTKTEKLSLTSFLRQKCSFSNLRLMMRRLSSMSLLRRPSWRWWRQRRDESLEKEKKQKEEEEEEEEEENEKEEGRSHWWNRRRRNAILKDVFEEVEENAEDQVRKDNEPVLLGQNKVTALYHTEVRHVLPSSGEKRQRKSITIAPSGPKPPERRKQFAGHLQPADVGFLLRKSFGTGGLSLNGQVNNTRGPDSGAGIRTGSELRSSKRTNTGSSSGRVKSAQKQSKCSYAKRRE